MKIAVIDRSGLVGSKLAPSPNKRVNTLTNKAVAAK
jgi:hypothetical protein